MGIINWTKLDRQSHKPMARSRARGGWQSSNLPGRHSSIKMSVLSVAGMLIVKIKGWGKGKALKLPNKYHCWRNLLHNSQRCPCRLYPWWQLVDIFIKMFSSLSYIKWRHTWHSWTHFFLWNPFEIFNTGNVQCYAKYEFWDLGNFTKWNFCKNVVMILIGKLFWSWSAWESVIK